MGVEPWPITLRQSGPVSRHFAAIRCIKCEAVTEISAHIRGETWKAGSLGNTDWIVRHWQKRGWVNPHAGVGICRVCANLEKTKGKEYKMSKPSDVIPLKPQVKREPSPASAQAKALLYMSLADNYDVIAKCYKNGFSDEEIAKGCGLSLEFVRKRREEDFGPLAPRVDPAKAIEEIVVQNLKVQTTWRELMAGKIDDFSRNIVELGAAIRGLETAVANAKSPK